MGRHFSSCSTNNCLTSRYFSSCSRNKDSTVSYLSSTSGNSLSLIVIGITTGLTCIREVAASFSHTRMIIQKPAKSPDCLLGVVTQPTDSRLSETMVVNATHIPAALGAHTNRLVGVKAVGWCVSNFTPTVGVIAPINADSNV